MSALHPNYLFIFERLPSWHLSVVTCLEQTMEASICGINMRNRHENQCVKRQFKVNKKLKRHKSNMSDAALCPFWDLYYFSSM